MFRIDNLKVGENKIVVISLLFLSVVVLTGVFIFSRGGSCFSRGLVRSQEGFQDGTYRGTYVDTDSIQVALEFRLKDGIVTEFEFRYLKRDEDYFIGTEEEPYRSVIAQYQELVDHLVGRDLSERLSDLYYPEDIIQTSVDGYTSATVRSSKIISAIRDALNRGVYSY